MKYWILTLLLCLTSLGYAQFQWGIQGGLNFNNKLELDNLTVSDTPGTFDILTDQKTGWHGGFFGQVNFAVFRLRSELQYTYTEASINNEALKVETIDLPITLGYKVLPPVSVFAGPIFQYQMVDNSFDSFAVENLENEIGMGVQLGIRIYFKKIGFNIRHERSFNTNEQQLINIENRNPFGNFNSRENQWILGISIQLN